MKGVFDLNFTSISYKTEGASSSSVNMCRVRQRLDKSKVNNPEASLAASLATLELPTLEGKRIAVTAGSRGIAGITCVTRCVINFLKSRGASVFIIPAMGSHGGGTAEGQLKLLEGYSITEETMGVPIISDMTTLNIGRTPGGVEIFCDKTAFIADYIVVINRVKAHSDFKAEYESGLCKMMMVGLGKHIGAATVHKSSSVNFGTLLPEAADVFIRTGKILFGVALIENAVKELSIIECLMPQDIVRKEKELLKIAKERQPNLYVRNADLLVIDEIGKNISGASMDPNITGRPPTGAPGFPDSPSKQIAVLGITPCSGGNAIGIGMADIISLDLARSIDFSSTYTNALTAGVICAGRIPMIANNESDVVLFSMTTLGKTSFKELNIVHIKNTSELENIEVSFNMANDVNLNKDKTEIIQTDLDLFESGTEKIRRLKTE